MNMKKMLGLMLCLVLTLVFSVTNASAVTVDGTISTGEWDGSIYEDAIGDNGSAAELAGWGAKIENGYLYWFCELGAGQTFDGTFYGTATGGDKKALPCLLMNVDCSDTTYIGYGDDENAVDNIVDSESLENGNDELSEWAVNHRGVDIGLQIGHSGSWTNGDSEVYHYGGIGGFGDEGFLVEYDLVGSNPVHNPSYGDWSTSGAVMEASISVDHLADIVASLGHARETTLGDYITLAVGVEGTDEGAVTWGLDVGRPKVIAADPVNKPLLSGDANLDGKVDGSDVTILANNWQNGVGAVDETVVWQAGDFNGDGKIDGSDVTILANSWQDGVAGMAASVPEPGTWMLLLSAVGTLLFRYKKR